MDARTRFKVAALQLCAAQGLTLAETEAAIKEAADRLEKSAGPVWDMIGGASKSLYDTALTGAGKVIEHGVIPLAKTTAVAVPALALGAGALVGHLAGRSGGITDEDVQEERQRELVDKYRDAVERITENRRRAQMAAAPAVRGRQLL